MISRYSIEIKEGIKGGEKRSEWGGQDWVSIRPGKTGYPPTKADRKIKKLTIKREGGKGGRSQIKEGN